MSEMPYWSEGVIPKGTYKNQSDDIPVVAFWNFAIGANDLSEEFVYNLVKMTFEKHEDLLAVDPTAKETVAENITKSSISLHAGALEYYKEQGIVASSLFGTVSGNSVANVVSTGAFTIPLMKKIYLRGKGIGLEELGLYGMTSDEIRRFLT